MKKSREPELLSGSEEGEILARLTERVDKAVTLIQQLRRERDELRQRLGDAERKLGEQADAGARVALLEEENERFTKERGEIRNRIEKVLGTLEAVDGGE